ncbi:MAG: DUF2878 domain-containing protein [Gammaproteobacteria bacterium]|nr:DUF2878 domain-containing protein [Gammaproteobacteria bacterium]
MPVIIFNLVALKAAWFACVLGGAASLPWIGVAAVGGLVALHLWLSPRVQPELHLLAAVGLAGAVWETFLVRTDLLSYPSGMIVSGTAPVWIVALWVGFATCLNVGMRWLKGRYAVAALFGAVGGPMAFYGGSRLGGVTFADTGTALLVLAAGWAVLMPTIVRLSERFDGWPDTTLGKAPKAAYRS